MEWFQLLGIIGAALVLGAYLLRQHARFGVGTIPYQLLNLAGALGMITYGMQINGAPIVIINTVWAFDTAMHLIPNLVKQVRPHSQIPELWKELVEFK